MDHLPPGTSLGPPKREPEPVGFGWALLMCPVLLFWTVAYMFMLGQSPFGSLIFAVIVLFAAMICLTPNEGTVK